MESKVFSKSSKKKRVGISFSSLKVRESDIFSYVTAF